MTVVPSPVAIWDEHPDKGAALSLLALTPYLLTDGSVQFLARNDAIPAGAILASVVDSGAGYDQIVTPVDPAGRRSVERGSLLILT